MGIFTQRLRKIFNSEAIKKTFEVKMLVDIEGHPVYFNLKIKAITSDFAKRAACEYIAKNIKISALHASKIKL